ncbi:receptor-type tyrosine-protein phosphatase beta-like isoform X2 [Rhinatrema bivittatum]|uniref:receptor-type tyrosine-protein phosphatase beta-like isoform X2 n=1 Tax=Rhinatrema bivittatum TaxID=194408 RepID=UPI001129CE10|nr:receptor-type tyrosine-protein phosphatase beta-like isoform X2 [Rhinatrema bivittatum]
MMYTFIITAFAGDNVTHGNWSQTSTYTRPEIIQNLNFLNISTTSVFLNWSRPVGNNSFYQIQVIEVPSTIINVSSESVSVDGLTPGMKYTFIITAFAGDNVTHGNWSQTSTYTRPEIIQNLNVLNISTTSVFLNWSRPVGNNSFYQIQVKEVPSTIINVSSESVSVDGLTPGMKYTFIIIAFAGDNVTHGNWSQTSTYTRPEIIQNLNVLNISTTSVFLNWSRPVGNNSFYQIQVIEVPSTIINVSSESVSVDGLTPGMKYTFIITAFAGDNITHGNWSQTSTYTRPEIIQKLNVLNISTTSVFLNWSRPVGNNSFYQIQLIEVPSTIINVSSESVSVDGLTPGMRYTFIITAFAGDNVTHGNWSQTSTYTRPEIIQKLNVLNISTTSVFLNWSRPVGNNSFYQIQLIEVPSTIINVSSESVSVDGLTPGMRYTFIITAFAGDNVTHGNWSQTSTYTRPEIIQKLNVLNISTTSVFLNWSRPVGNNSFYQIQLIEVPFTIINVSSESVSVDGLTPGMKYTFIITAFAGDNVTHGNWSQTSTYTRPEIIQKLNVLNISTTSVFLNWSRPVGNNSFYQIQVLEVPSKIINVSSESVSVDGLTPGMKYTFIITAFAGDNVTHGNWSQTSTYTRPEIIQKLNVLNISTTSVFLNWSRPVGNNSFYQIQLIEVPSTIINVSSESVSVDGLTPGMKYTFIITAFAGDNVTHGNWSQTSTYTRPEIIQKLNVLNISTTSVFLNWSRPVGNNSFYQIQLIEVPSTIINVSSESVSVDGLTPGMKYTFIITAFAGDNVTHGNWSQTSTYTRPEIIQKLNVLNISTTSVFLNWSRPVGNNSFYQIQVLEVPSKIINVSSESVSVDGLTPGMKYTFIITAFAGDNVTHGNWSQTSTYTRPEIIQKLNVLNISTTSVFLNWSRPVGNNSFYQIQVLEVPSKIINVSSESVSVDGLTPGMKYTFIITAFAGDNVTHGNWSQTSTYTRPEIIQKLNVLNISTTSVFLNWSRPVGNNSFYQIQVLEVPSKIINVSSESVSVDGLTPGMKYTFIITAFAGDNVTHGNWSQTSTYTRPEIIQKLNVLNISTTSVFLNWSRPVGNNSFYQIQVLEVPSKIINVSSESVSVDGLTPGMKYTFIITAFAGDNVTHGNWSQTSTYTRPEIIQKLNVLNISTTSVFLNWSRPVGNNSFYQIQVLEVPSKIINVSSESVSVDGLTPGMKYTFIITAFAGDNVTHGNWSQTSTYTRPEIIQKLNVLNISTTSVFLNWSRPVGNNSFYQIQVLEVPSKIINVSSESVSVDGLTPGMKYTFIITAFAGDNVTHGNWSQTSTYTRPEIIQKLNVLNISTTSVFLNWSRPVGNNSFYQIQVLEVPSKIINVSSESVSVDGLTPGMKYTFIITAFAGDNVTHGNWSQTSTYTRPEIIQKLNVLNISTTSVFLNWSRPVGNNSFYQIQVLEVPSKIINVSSESVSVDGLTPGMKYTFIITAFAGDNVTHGNWSQTSTYTRPDIIQNLNVLNISTTSVFLNWSRPVGNNSFYQIQVIEVPSKIINVSSESVSVDGLTPGMKYTFIITAFAGDNVTHGNWSQTSTYIRPEIIQNLNFLSISTTSVFLNWSRPVGNNSFYQIQVIEVPSKIINVSSESVSVDGLTPGMKYTFIITAFAGDNVTHGNWSQTSTYTRPEIIQNLNFLSISTTSVFLNWSRPVGNNSFYQIQVMEVPSTIINVSSESVSVDGLTPGMKYTFRITAFAGDNVTHGNWSQTSTYTNNAALYLSLKYSSFKALTNEMHGKILQELNKLLNQNFPDKKFTLVWKS